MAAVKKHSKKRASRASPAAPSRWLARTLAPMTLGEKLGQLLMVPFWGRFAPERDPQFQQLLRWAADGKIGGLMLEARRTPLGLDLAQAYPTAALLNRLQESAKIPLLVAADFETGTAMRLAEGTSLPHPMAIAATGHPQDAYAHGRITAIEARAAGVHWLFAPVADVNHNPANPIINIRSFGENPQRVARLVAEYVRGAQAGGALATAKHFPGHGDTEIDSHLNLPVIAAARKRIGQVDLVPFRAAIRAGVGAIMTGHLLVPALEPDPRLPATLSPRILDELLRRQMGFRGLVVTDALEMAGITRHFAPASAAALAVLAGADILLLPPRPEAALESLRDALRAGRIPLAKIDAAVGRILEAKRRLGLFHHRTVRLSGLNGLIRQPEFTRRALDIAARGLTLLRDDAHLLPLDATRPLRLLLVAISGDPDRRPGDGLEAEIRWRADEILVRRADTKFHPARLLELPPPSDYDAAILALYVRVADRKGTVSLPEEAAALARAVLASDKPVIVACFGSPYTISNFPQARAWMAAFSTQPVAEQAMGRAIFGETAVGGRLPVTVAAAAPAGAGLHVAARPMTLERAPGRMKGALEPAYKLLRQAVADRLFPGAVLAAGHNGRLALRPLGRLTYAAKSAAVKEETIYDLASLTKPLVTATAIMQLAEAGDLQLDAPVGRYLPEWEEGLPAEWRAKATLADLLRHSSGLPAHREYFRHANGYQAVIARVLKEPLEREPGARILYSDLGFMLLGEIVRRTTGQALDAYARAHIFAPLGMNHSMFRPSPRLRPRIAPTENDRGWRNRQVWGRVHDANAEAMGGIAGHAGLFSTAGDLAVFCQMMLNGGIYAHHRLLRRKTIAEFTRRQEIAGGAFALGWDVPTGASSSGRYFSSHSFGHTGFTGTSIWIDPEKNLFLVLLTNRVFPSAAGHRIRRLRPALHDAVWSAWKPEGAS